MTEYGMDAEGWVTFWWEGNEAPAEDAVVRMIQAIGDDPGREGLKETPARVTRSWKELYGGYGKDPKDVLKVFQDGACDEMVVLKDIEFFSTCEHHMLPFFGKVHIGYIPDGKVVGVSKLARLVEIFSRRLQIQERFTGQIANALMEHLQPKGAMVVVEAKHLCMVARGVGKQNSTMVTSAVRGAFDNDKTRAEFLRLTEK